jgi:hypothetical protein
MVLSPEEVEKRLLQLEEEVAQLRRRVESCPGETAAEPGCRTEAPRLDADAEWARICEKMGLPVEPFPGIETLRAREVEHNKMREARKEAREAAKKKTPPGQTKASRRG